MTGVGLSGCLAVLETQLNAMADMEPVSLGITDESFDAIPVASFAAPRPDLETLSQLTVVELKRLAEAHRLDGAASADRAQVIDMLCQLCPPGQPDAASSSSLGGLPLGASRLEVSQPSQCAICMSDFQVRAAPSPAHPCRV